MIPLNKVLLAIAAIAVVSGPALANAVNHNLNPGASSPDVPDSSSAFSASKSHSFADIVDLRVGADHQMVTPVVDAASRAPAESLAQSAGIYDLLLALSDGPDAAGSVLGVESPKDDPVIDLPAVLIPGAHAAGVPGASDRQMGDGLLFSVAAIPEPADWMTLLCGLVVVAFMARRRTGAVGD